MHCLGFLYLFYFRISYRIFIWI